MHSTGPREPTHIYIQEHQLDLILTMAKDGS